MRGKSIKGGYSFVVSYRDSLGYSFLYIVTLVNVLCKEACFYNKFTINGGW